MNNLSQIGDYTIKRELGAGGFGVVYLVEKDGKQYALKKLSESVVSADVSERFIKEALKIEEIRKKHNIEYLVKIYEVIFDQKSFVMEFIKEDSISYFKNNKDANFIISFIYSVNQLHEIGIAHRDIKPENLRVKDNKPVLIDFGVASWWDSKSNIIPTGTRYYSPPEIICMFDEYKYAKESKKASKNLIFIKPKNAKERIKYIKKLHDVYSLGITIGELLTGILPFNKLSYFEYLDNGTSEGYKKWLKQIPKEFREFVTHATAFNPKNRSSLSDLIQKSEYLKHPKTKVVNSKISVKETLLDFWESKYQCNDCEKEIEPPAKFCPYCRATFSTLTLVVEPVQELELNITSQSLLDIKFPEDNTGKILINIDIKKKDFTFSIGRDYEKSDISFVDDNWMSGVHGFIKKRGNKVFYIDGVGENLPTNPSNYNNIPVGKNEVELLCGSFLILGSSMLTVKKIFGGSV